MPGCRRSRLDTVKFFSRTHVGQLRVGPAAAARHRTISRMNMRNPATTPPVFDPRTIDPNRVPTGLKVLIVASFMIAVGFGLVAPVLPNYAQNFNATVTMATMVVSALAITRLLFAPSAGQLITRWGERPVYTIGMLIVSVTSFMIAFAWDYWVLLASRAVAGIGSVMFTVCECWNVSACAEAYICPERLSSIAALVGSDIVCNCAASIANLLTAPLPFSTSSSSFLNEASRFSATFFLIASASGSRSVPSS